MNMRLIGCSSVDQLNPTLVDTRALSMHSTGVPGDTLSLRNYDPLAGPKEMAIDPRGEDAPKSKL